MASNPSVSCDFLPHDVKLDGLPLIQVSDLSKHFSDKRDVTAIHHIHAAIEEGQITAIIGESGSGKSTFLRLLYGLIEPDSGEVRYRGWKVAGPREKLIPGHGAMRMVSQHFDDLNTYANVWDNVASRLSNTDLLAKEQKTRAILIRLGIEHLARQRVANLSGGERQRTAIARALVTDPEVLLMDEPFNQVDAAFRDKLQQDIRNIVNESGLTVVLVSHDPAEVLAIADFLLILRNGKLVASGKPADLYRLPPDPYSAALLAKSNILTTEEAISLGLNAGPGKQVGIHPEWVLAQPDNAGIGLVQAIYFKGFYEEIEIMYGQMALKGLSMSPTGLKQGDRVSIRITDWITFN